MPSRLDLSGLLFTSALGITAYFAAPFIQGINAILLGLVGGVVLGNVITLPSIWKSGIDWATSSLLEISIVFLGFTINYVTLAAVGTTPLLVIIATVLLIVIASTVLNKWVNCPGKTGLLIGFGTAICGSAAVVTASVVLKAEKRDTGMALAVVNLLGAVGMLAMPLLLGPIGLSGEAKGLLVGGSLHAVGNVAGAGYALGDVTGDFALTIKMARVALLSPALLLFLWWTGRGAEKGVWRFPMYLILFFAATIISSLSWIPGDVRPILNTAGKVMLTIAMTAIGLRISIRSLYKGGKVAFRFGALIFLIQILLVGLGVAIFGVGL